MTGISSGVGLVSGIDYNSLVNQLIQLESIKRDNLLTRTQKLESEESSLTSLTALFLTSSYMIGNLNKADAFNRCDVTSSNESLITAKQNGVTVPSVYTFTPVRTASAQQTVAKGVASQTEALGKTGTVTISKGWSLEKDIELGELNGGDGITKGYIRITDGSGTRATIDLRSCLTMNDVLDAINENQSIDVWAEVDGDKLVITDMSGDNKSELKIQEVNGGRTAASLGILGTGSENADGDQQITGNSVYYLGENTKLSSLNDGNGLVFDDILDDLIVTCKDGTQITIDFNHRATEDEKEAGAPAVYREETIGDLLNTINNAEGNDGKFVASIAADGKSLVFTDNTTLYVSADDADPDDVDPDDPTTKYVLPDGYDDPNEYEIDEDGNVIYKEGNTLGKPAGEKVVDPDAPPTEIAQHQLLGSVPILRTLGVVDRYSSVDKPTFEGSLQTRNLIGGLNSPLVSSLNGGYGLADAKAGSIEVQDRAGNKALISFNADELKTLKSGSLDQAIAMFNDKLANANAVDKDGQARVGVEMEVDINDTKTGLKLIDMSGGTSHNLIFKDLELEVPVTDEHGDPVLDDENNPVTEKINSNIAGSLGLKVDEAKSTVDGKSVNLQTVSYTTKLADMNGGKGITMTGAKIQITDSAGGTAIISFDSKQHTTLGDVIDAINSEYDPAAFQVRAQLNSTGDGIELVDMAGGDGVFSCEDATSSSKFAKEMNLVKSVSQEDRDAGHSGKISGGSRYEVEIEATDSLEDIKKKINDLGGNFAASIIVDGTGSPYRLVITGGSTGANGAMNIDLSCLGLSTENMTEAQDALLAYGDALSSTSVLLSSSSNTFKSVVEGIDITIHGTSTSPVTVTSAKTSTDIKASLSMFVENYNKFREELNVATYYDTQLNAGNVLYNNSIAKAFDRDISNILLKEVHGIPGINSLKSLGISMGKNVDEKGNLIETNKQTGKLTFDETVFDAIWESNPEGVQEFLFKQQEILDPEGGEDKDGNPKMITINTGWAQSFMDVAESLTGADSGKVTVALQTLDTKINKNYEDIEYMDARLEVKKKQLLNQFYSLETSLAKMSNDMTTVSSIASSWSSNSTATSTGY